MPFHLNKVMLSGTLTRDPELKYTPKGTANLQIGLAINRVWKDDQGQKHEEVTFADVEVWGRTAEVIAEYCFKGHTIYIEGRLKLDTWDDKQTGQKRSKMKVVCENFSFVSQPKEGGGEQRKPQEDYSYGPQSQSQSPQGRAPSQGRTPPARPQPPVDPDLDPAYADDIPF